MNFYSVVVPVYNRPDEVRELLNSLTEQTFKNFEVLIIEDGSTNRCEEVVNSLKDSLNIQYFFKENSGKALLETLGLKEPREITLLFLTPTV